MDKITAGCSEVIAHFKGHLVCILCTAHNYVNTFFSDNFDGKTKAAFIVGIMDPTEVNPTNIMDAKSDDVPKEECQPLMDI
jgi:hypothetical protein